MNENKFNAMNDAEFESLLKNMIFDMPPKEVVSAVTPWKRAMNYALIGMALTTVTLNFRGLNYVLPLIGWILSFLGYRALRWDNKWFRACFSITVIRTVLMLSMLILNTTVYHSEPQVMQVTGLLNFVTPGLDFMLFICLRGGLREVQEKAGTALHSGAAGALIAWYAAICVLALFSYTGWIIFILLVVSYFFILRNLFVLSQELDEAGYAVQTSPVHLTDRMVVTCILAVLLVGFNCGYLFGNRYPMKWEAEAPDAYDNVQKIREELLELGFPERVLNDISPEDIAACEGATQVFTEQQNYAVLDGYRLFSEIPSKDLLITGVAVELPGEQKTWKIIHHFKWTGDSGIWRTEAIQVHKAYKYGQGWADAGDVSGRVLCDQKGLVYTAPFYYLGEEKPENGGFVFTNSAKDILAAFSFPKKGERKRGYIAYDTYETEEGRTFISWDTHSHQSGVLQFPAKSAMEHITDQVIDPSQHPVKGLFVDIPDNLHFHKTEDGVRGEKE